MLLQSPHDKMHFAVIGQPRTGKTTFIAAIRNLTIDETEPESCYSKEPEANNSILDDTVQFDEIQTGLDQAKDQAYLESLAIKNIDEYILVIDDRTETSWIQNQICRCPKLPVIVRSKVLIDILNNKLAIENSANDNAIISNLKKTLKETIDVQCLIFVVDSYFQAKFEFLDLAKHLLRHVISQHRGLIPREKGVWRIKLVLNSCNLPWDRENDNVVEVQPSDEETVNDPEATNLQERGDSVPGRSRRIVRSFYTLYDNLKPSVVQLRQKGIVITASSALTLTLYSLSACINLCSPFQTDFEQADVTLH